MSSPSRTKLRRAHTKSRNGCLRCKGQRKKCDEQQPRCGRCEELGIDCQYPKRRSVEPESRSAAERSYGGGASLHAPGDSDSDTYRSQASASPHPGMAEETIWPTSWPTSWDPSGAGGHARLAVAEGDHGSPHAYGCPAPERQSSVDMLDKRDLELLSHYLSHTCRIIPLDENDAYALQVGFPNLAFGNQALMSSLLALAAACRCHDLLAAAADGAHDDDDDDGPGTLDRIRDLLAVAEQHHRASLRQTREAIPRTERYDCILASAALMVLYGSASHCVRIRMVELHGAGRPDLPADVVPVQSQWMSLIRAVHFAYVGVAAGGARSAAAATAQAQAAGRQEAAPRWEDAAPRVVVTEPNVEAVSCPQDGPADDTRRLFLPIVASTSASAMRRLRARAARMGHAASSAAAGGGADLQPCWEALAMLERTVGRVLAGAGGVAAACPPVDPLLVAEAAPEPSLPDVVAPWLRTYIARVTSNNNSNKKDEHGETPLSPLRRTVSAFLNRVPASYMSLVQTTLDCIPPDWGAGVADDETRLREAAQGLEVSVAHRLAVDIFAHWLVFMLLLDGVWWIGEIGSWELGRAVAFMRDGGGLRGLMDKEEDAWWPESMYKLGMELRETRRVA